jgi:hypothetical protein
VLGLRLLLLAASPVRQDSQRRDLVGAHVGRSANDCGDACFALGLLFPVLLVDDLLDVVQVDDCHLLPCLSVSYEETLRFTTIRDRVGCRALGPY